ncbi:hypothetical protein K502DRAFT_343694 [Neoconidiobolus thromboides FSU 785]|nr:hypothetical protein K502DRAFT_343694 [Neoconidiobolus thromboides FSU 785]
MNSTDNMINKGEKTRNRKVVNLNVKRAIIQLGEEGLSHKAIAERFEIGRSTVTKILLRKEIILKSDSNENSIIECNKPRILNELESLLFQWCTGEGEIKSDGAIYINKNVTRKSILNKAKDIANDMNLSNFPASLSWFKGFVGRYNIVLPTKQKSILVVKSNVPEDYVLGGKINSSIPLSVSTPQEYHSIASSFPMMSSAFQNYSEISYNIPMRPIVSFDSRPNNPYGNFRPNDYGLNRYRENSSHSSDYIYFH